MGSLAGAAHLLNINADALRPKGEKLALFGFVSSIRIAKAWPIDPLSPERFWLEVTEKLPQG
ncbi:hypothetical protein GNI_239110 [Gregarina niphandrodes]|uniref:Uncharacterized protein n=1 Tax=Gregarina niphandrodes TaxID=110365 RepID=A0A023AWP6_GRENI|nr:hypothetical protein GNI_239110 [Gregarina niphandrodes]EZG42665.1 hypothetical protein GNI_239110 [Gregarina niphandrodes]|eukprot:XP_011134776.1 hypothetical protein GNI_239110 [Gregarina niphandrodes]